MSKPWWKQRKFWSLSIAALTLAITLPAGWWWITLEHQVTEGLRTKKFLPPTQFYSAPELITVDRQLSRADLIQIFENHKYARKGWQDHLKAGEYALATASDCGQILPTPLPDDVRECVLFIPADVGDPELKETGLQLVAFDLQDQIRELYKGNPLTVTTQLGLEPELIAQYLEHQPIQQIYKPLGEMPVACLNAVLAIEDNRFLEHSGVSFTGIARAAFHNLTGSRYAQGGSTITQQMVKNYFLTSERTLKRKITEFFMSLILEAHSSKDEILETYLNIIYLGQNGPFQVRGFPAAANYYFHKPIEQLNSSECAMLAATLNSPGLYDPFRKPDNARKRRNLVLDKMVEHEYISATEATSAKEEALPTHTQVSIAETAPYYIDAVQRELTELSLPSTGVKVFTGLNRQAQAQAQTAVQSQLAKLEKDNALIKKLKASGKVLEASLISADNATGLIQALVGGRGFKATQFNRVLDGHRQVGSVMKPFVFLAALESEKFKPTSIVHDIRFTHAYGNQSWSPENYGHEYLGDVPAFVALKNSLNCATASLGIEVGLEKVVAAAKAAGMTSRLDPLPSVTLGAFEITPIEVLQAYNTLANFGDLHRLRTLRSVIGENESVIYRNHDSSQPVLNKGATAELVGMLKQTMLAGTGKSAAAYGLHQPSAGKTGTTSEYKDSWFAGFTPFATTITWVGFDDNTATGLTGASGALPIWAQFMTESTKSWKEKDFQWPKETHSVRVEDPAISVGAHKSPASEAELIFAGDRNP
jgi:penicillin-binding protein 1B